MIVNDSRERPAHVRFVSYSGKWPNLCSGVLVLDIDGVQASFGDMGGFGPKLPDGSRPEHPKFWATGGTCQAYPDPLLKGEWRIDVSALPEKYRQYAEEIDAVVNAGIEHGCCGGCR